MSPGSLRALTGAGRVVAEETSVDDSDRNDEAPQDGGREDQAGLEAALAARDAEVSELRRRLVEAPRRIHELEPGRGPGTRS